MLITLIVWVYILFISYNLGFFCYLIVGESKKKPLEEYCLIGLFGSMVILNYFSFFVSISVVPNIVLFLFSIAHYLFNYKRLKSKTIIKGSKWFHLSLTIFFVFTVIQAIKTPFVTDTWFYHAQTVQWFEKYPVVKGLANIHGRFGFNSSYHLATALFSFTNLFGQSLHNALPSFLFIAFVAYGLRQIFCKNRSNFSVYLFSGVLLLLLIFYRPWISSPSPDFPTTVYVLLVLYFFYQWLNNSDKSLLFIIPLLSFTLLIIKVSSLVILLVPVAMLFLIKGQQNKKNYFIYLVLSFAIIVTPWLVRNVLISGYLIYPFPYLDLFSFKWEVPYDLVVREKEWVKSFSRVSSYDWQSVKKLTFNQWFSIWWKNKIFIEKTVFVAIVFSPLVFLFDYVKNRNTSKGKNFNLRILYLISLSGIIFWFYMGPYFRFAHGFIIVCFLLTVYLVFAHLKKYLAVVTCSVMLFFAVYSIYRKVIEIDLSKFILKPQPYKLAETRKVKYEGFILYIPEKQLWCYNHPVPCTPYENPDLKLLGDKIEDGFYVESQ